MLVITRSAKILALKLTIFIIVASGLLWSADYYARTRNIDVIESGAFLSSATSTQEMAAQTMAGIEAVNSPDLSLALASSSDLHDQSLTAPILMYHYISAPTAITSLPGLYLDPVIFESQLQEIVKGGYETVFMSRLAVEIRNGADLKNKAITLTFDDGYEDFYLNAYPLLKKYNLKGTLYIIVNALDKPGYITSEQLKEMAVSGHVEIGSHTYNHPDLRTKDKAAQYYEIKGSKDTLEDILQKPVLTFAYPYGYHNDMTLKITAEAGYLGAISVIPGTKHEADNPWLITRLRPGNRSGEEFAKWLNFGK